MWIINLNTFWATMELYGPEGDISVSDVQSDIFIVGFGLLIRFFDSKKTDLRMDSSVDQEVVSGGGLRWIYTGGEMDKVWTDGYSMCKERFS